jgi:hypothetical protein
MPMTSSLIETAMTDNAANPTRSQSDAAKKLADAIVATISSATISYVAGLTAPPGGGAVVGTLSTATIS